MKKGKSELAGYEIFSSKHRGTEEGAELLKLFIQKKQTPENLMKLASEVSIVWPQIKDENDFDVKLSLSRFQEKLEKNKQEIKEYLDQEREKKTYNK